MTRQRLLRIAKPLFGLALLVLLLRQVEVGDFVALVRQGDPVLLAASVGSFVCALAGFQALRLHVLVRDFTRSWGDSLRLFFIGAFFNNLLPSNVGGDAVRLLYLRRMGDGDWAAPLARLMLHRVSGILGLFAAFMIYAPLRFERLGQVLSTVAPGRRELSPGLVAVVCAGGLGALLAGVLVLRHPRFAPVNQRFSAFLRRFGRALQTVSSGTLLHLTLLTAAFHGMRMLGLFWGLRFFDATIPFWDLLPVLAVTAVVALLPLTVGGLGLVEGSLGGGLALFGVPTEAAIGAALLHRAGLLLVALLGGLVYLGQRDALQAQVADGSGEPRA